MSNEEFKAYEGREQLTAVDIADPDHVQRMCDELRELEERYRLLNVFIASEFYTNLLTEQQNLLVQQEEVMSNYITVLRTRIETDRKLAGVLKITSEPEQVEGPCCSEQALEAEIVDKKLTAPRITPDMLDAEISSEQYHVFEGSCLTVCCLTLQNGFTVSGESACASPENFDESIGRKIAFKNAREKIWPLLGFRLKDQLSA